MAMLKVAQLKGFDRKFKISENARPYTLRDNGFTTSKNGVSVYTRKLDPANRPGLVIRIQVDKNLEKLEISTMNENALVNVDVSKLADNEEMIETINFLFDHLVNEGCFEEVE